MAHSLCWGESASRRRHGHRRNDERPALVRLLHARRRAARPSRGDARDPERAIARFPIPVAILARLAVDVDQQNRGIGAALLNDALARAVRASQQVAVRALVVHAVDDNAATFYERFGFRALAGTPRTLMVTLAALRDAGYR